MTITYAHAIKDPYDLSIKKPFKLVEVEVEVFTGLGFDGFRDFHEAVVVHGGDILGSGSDNDSLDAAIGEALFNAEYGLMDLSRDLWEEVAA